MKYFNINEFKCGCCGKEEMDNEFLMKLDAARGQAGVSFTVTSGYRCPAHNKAVGGSPNSSHMLGYAVDIACRGDADRWVIVDALMKVGINRIGVAKSFIHCDIDPNKNGNRLWVY